MSTDLRSNLRGAITTREGMATALTSFPRQELRSFQLVELGEISIPPRGCFVGQWGDRTGDPLPDLMVVLPQDRADTLAWLSAYFAALTPLTQWCRLLTQDQVRPLAALKPIPELGARLTAWTGVILAECSAQANGAINLREMPGTGALSSSSFAAGRASAVWGGGAPFQEIGQRHDELTVRLRAGGRPISAEALVPLWQFLSGVDQSNLDVGHPGQYDALVDVIDVALNFNHRTELPEFLVAIAEAASQGLGLPGLVECARGPQLNRLRALDRVVPRVVNSVWSDAIVGFSASLVEPGAAVLPDLLKRYTKQFPLSPMWLGLFAGIWSPFRVLNDQSGLGRLISKALLAPLDLASRPNCDISYEEVIRWLPQERGAPRPDIRGLVSRSLNVELLPGVVASIAYGRAEQQASLPLEQPREDSRSVSSSRSAARSSDARDARSMEDALSMIDKLASRIDRLERDFIESQIGQLGSDQIAAKPRNPKKIK